ncbi:MAG: hypothetical protein ACJ77N_10105 [Chloroflexota bacterium]
MTNQPRPNDPNLMTPAEPNGPRNEEDSDASRPADAETTTEGGLRWPAVDTVAGVDVEDRYRQGGPKDEDLTDRLAEEGNSSTV